MLRVTDTTIVNEVRKLIRGAHDAVKLKYWDVSEVRNFDRLFEPHYWYEDWLGSDLAHNDFWDDPENFIGGWAFAGYGGISMTNMFAGNDHFNQDISAWDVSHVTNMRGMFAYTKRFNRPLDKWKINYCRVEYMFEGASSFLSDLPTFSESVAYRTKAQDVFGNSRLWEWAPFPKSESQTLFEFCKEYNKLDWTGSAELRGVYEASKYGLVRADPTRAKNYELYDKVVDHPDLKQYLKEFYDSKGIANKQPNNELRGTFANTVSRRRVTGLGGGTHSRRRAPSKRRRVRV